MFREDLLYRLNTVHIELPPLRERGDDLILLTEYFLGKYAIKYDKPGLKIGQGTMNRLKQYSWPGNVRELQHAIENAVIMCETNVLMPADFNLHAKTLTDINTLNLEEIRLGSRNTLLI